MYEETASPNSEYENDPQPSQLTLSQRRGRPHVSTLPQLVRAKTGQGVDLVAVLVNIANGKYGAKPAVRLQAVNILLDRGFGKVVQPHELGGAGLMPGEDNELIITVRRVSARDEANEASARGPERDLGIPAVGYVVPAG